ncbi:UNVERIFIED_CONTAM: hypothetical protein GTU68_031185, partial [Idotea baltica]|nr:hypothetical protein [Idotea baltica]
RFVVITDSEDYFSLFTSVLLQHIPQERLGTFDLEHREAWYPKDRFSTLKGMFRACSSERLFIPSILKKDFDLVVYLDTDIVFMRPPEDLWDEFDLFKQEEVIGMAPNLVYYATKRNNEKIPFYGETGLNAGVLLMNLTAIDCFPGGWIPTCFQIIQQYDKKLKYGDQDLLNVLFQKFPGRVHEIGCEWNVRGFLCRPDAPPCRSLEQTGTALLHGNNFAFYSRQYPRIKVRIFSALLCLLFSLLIQL